MTKKDGRHRLGVEYPSNFFDPILYAWFGDSLSSFMRLFQIQKNVRQYFDTKGKILNVGCGKNELGIFLKFYGYNRIDTLDINPDNRPTFIHDIRKPYPIADNQYKGIIATHILEHIPYNFFEPNLIELKRILSPGGLLLLALPYRSRVAKLGFSITDKFVVQRVLRIPRSFKQHGFHYWEISKEHPINAIKATVQQHFKIVKTDDPFIAPREVCYLLKKGEGIND